MDSERTGEQIVKRIGEMTERERFERWWQDEKQTKTSPITLDGTWNHAWEAWQAAKEESKAEIERKDKIIQEILLEAWDDPEIDVFEAVNITIKKLKEALSKEE